MMVAMTFPRDLALGPLVKKNSFFLFGPRGTGKTTLIRHQFTGARALIIDLLNSLTFRRLQADPGLLERMIEAESVKPQVVVIDEVQKIPDLLDEVHRLIEKLKIHFLLSGSSSRKLKSSGANLLGGRAWRADLFSLTSHELQSEFNLERVLRWGTLPRVWSSNDPAEELNAYVDIYLKEEIMQEGLVRKLPQFSSFLKFAALSSGDLLNFESLAQEIGVSAPTIRGYYEILKDTLLAFELEPFQKTKKRRPVATSKIYLFDMGVTNAVAEIESLDRASNLYGARFKQFIGNELRAYLSYSRLRKELRFWRSLDKYEVDFVVGQDMAIEVKATQKVSEKHLRGLRALQEEKLIRSFYLVSQDPVAQMIDGIHVLPYQDFLHKLWGKKLGLS